MRKYIIIGLSTIVCACSSAHPVTSDTVPGPVLFGRYAGEDSSKWLPFTDDKLGNKSVIATQAYVDNKTFTLPGELKSPLAINTGTTGSKIWLGMYSSGSGHTNAPKTLDNSSQFLKIGSREYGKSSYRGIGFGYAGIASDIQPVFIGEYETDTDANTAGDIVFATRASNKNVVPVVRLSVTSSGDIAAASDYTPKNATSLVTKAYVDKAIADAYAKGYAAGVEYGLAHCPSSCSAK